MREEGGRDGGEDEGGGESLGWVNEYWSLEGSASCRRSWTRDEEESPRAEEKAATEERRGQEGQDGNRGLDRTGERPEEGDGLSAGLIDEGFPSKEAED